MDLLRFASVFESLDKPRREDKEHDYECHNAKSIEVTRLTILVHGCKDKRHMCHNLAH